MLRYVVTSFSQITFMNSSNNPIPPSSESRYLQNTLHIFINSQILQKLDTTRIHRYLLSTRIYLKEHEHPLRPALLTKHPLYFHPSGMLRSKREIVDAQRIALPCDASIECRGISLCTVTSRARSSAEDFKVGAQRASTALAARYVFVYLGPRVKQILGPLIISPAQLSGASCYVPSR